MIAALARARLERGAGGRPRDGGPSAWRRGAALAAAMLAAAGCSGVAPSGRYVAEHFRTTRTNFEYVRDRVTGQWIPFELRCQVVATDTPGVVR